MIHDLELARLYAKRFAQPVLANSKLNPDRIRQYRKARLIDPNLTDEAIHTEIAESSREGLAGWLEKLRSILVAANPDISAQAASAPIIQIDSYDRYTALKAIENTEPVIYVDTGLLMYLWRLNKHIFTVRSRANTHPAPLLRSQSRTMRPRFALPLSRPIDARMRTCCRGRKHHPTPITN